MSVVATGIMVETIAMFLQQHMHSSSMLNAAEHPVRQFLDG
jgi:hypothetical protein